MTTTDPMVEPVETTLTYRVDGLEIPVVEPVGTTPTDRLAGPKTQVVEPVETLMKLHRTDMGDTKV